MPALLGLLLIAQMQGAMAQTSDATPPVQPVQSPSQGQGSGRHHGHGLLKQLGLSQEQRQQIKQIVQSTPKGKERRRQIMAVLTPEQRAQLKSLRAARRAERGQQQPQQN